MSGLSRADSAPLAEPVKALQALEITGVFTGRELTRKDRRLSSGLTPIDRILGAGIVRGRISEIVGPVGTGKTSLAACFVASATREGEAVAWIDSAGSFDPMTVAAAGADLTRVLWSSPRVDRTPRFELSGQREEDTLTRRHRRGRTICCANVRRPFDFAQGKPHLPGQGEVTQPTAWNDAPGATIRAAELVLEAGGFGLVVIDFGNSTRAIPHSAALRVARIAERTGAAVIVLAKFRMCGTFAAQSLMLSRIQACFSRRAIGAPSLFDGFAIEALVARNKLGGVGARASWHALVDVPSPVEPFAAQMFADLSPRRWRLIRERWRKQVPLPASGRG
ncbi:MAG: hypothetical protein ACHQZS_11420 [Candidatus Binatales bacterium]